MSHEFAEDAAAVLAAEGIPALVFAGLRAHARSRAFAGAATSNAARRQ